MQTKGVQELLQSQLGLASPQTDPSPYDSPGSPAESQYRALCTLAVLLLPALLALSLSLLSSVRGVPLAVGLVRGFQRTAPVLACLLVILYGGLILGTLRQERMVSNGLERSLHGEGAYLTEQTGQKWPGTVR